MPSSDITFYCGLSETNWNHHPTAPGSHTCISPVYGRSQRTKSVTQVSVPKDTEVIIDSGAFSDTTDNRLTYEQALHRQVAHVYRFGYVSQVSHIASYDCLIDEKWQDGERHKQRWTLDEAEGAVFDTIQAAAYLAERRDVIPGIFCHPVGLILSAQGVDAEQYVRCAEQIVPLLGNNDIFGLGGFCVTGLMPAVMMPPFREIVRLVVPYLGKQGVRRLHVWGVCYAPALNELLGLCKQYGIQLSTDSSGPQRRPTLAEWGYSGWRDNSYKMAPILGSCRVVDDRGRKTPTCAPGTRCKGLERARHVELVRQWLENFSERESVTNRKDFPV